MLSLETFMPAHGLALDFLLKNSKLNQLVPARNSLAPGMLPSIVLRLKRQPEHMEKVSVLVLFIFAVLSLDTFFLFLIV